jgi:hypothetical protein
MSKHLTKFEQYLRMETMSVNLFVWLGVVAGFLLPYSLIPLLPLYVLPAGAWYTSTKGSLLWQHSKQALVFSVLFAFIYPLVAYGGLLLTIAGWGGQEAIAERFVALFVAGEQNPIRLAFTAAYMFDQTSDVLLTVQAVAYVFALAQVALLLIALIWPLVNVFYAYKQRPPHYPLFPK